MEARQIILQGFEYDLWANRQWIRAIGSFKDLTRAHTILEHILRAQSIWLERCGRPVDLPGENTDLSTVFAASSRSWIAFIEDANLDEVVHYNNLQGVPYQETVGKIALHVINHGTYHRGHLRGIAMSEGNEKFPETDMIAYFREIG